VVAVTAFGASAFARLRNRGDHGGRVLNATSPLFHSRERNFGLALRSARCKSGRDRGGVIQSTINFERTRRGPQSANALRDIFSRVVTQNGEFDEVAVHSRCFSGTVFAQSAPPKVGNKLLVQPKPKASMDCKLVGTVRGTKLWAGDCVGSELRGSTTTTENQDLPKPQATGSITPDQKE
jgi:hypothetical protein